MGEVKRSDDGLHVGEKVGGMKVFKVLVWEVRKMVFTFKKMFLTDLTNLRSRQKGRTGNGRMEKYKQ